MLVLFDVDDTLLDDASATRDAVDALREYLKSGVAELEFRTRWLESSRHHFERYVAGQIDFQGNVGPELATPWRRSCRMRMRTRTRTRTRTRFSTSI